MTLDQAYYHNKALERQDERERDCGMAGACEYYWNSSEALASTWGIEGVEAR